MIAGIGIDTVDVVSFRERLNENLVNELFLAAEINYCKSQVRYWENFAARFAAKEATFKAMGSGLSSGLRFKDVEIVKCYDSGSISLSLHGDALILQKEMNISKLLVSVSHTKLNAIAIVIAEREQV